MNVVNATICVGVDEFDCELETEDGTNLDAIRLAVELPDGTCEDRRYVPEKTAMRKIRSFGEVGRCNCSSCNWLIDPHDLYCRRCGARLTVTDVEVVKKC